MYTNLRNAKLVKSVKSTVPDAAVYLPVLALPVSLAADGFKPGVLESRFQLLFRQEPRPAVLYEEFVVRFWLRPERGVKCLVVAV